MRDSAWAKRRFVDAVTAGGDVALDELALLLPAAIGFVPRIDLVAGLTKLDELAADVASPTIDGVCRSLFRGDRALVGHRDDYYEPRNSFIEDVLSTRRGIPISLSVIAMEVGRRVGVDLVGVGMPGHFLIAERPTHGLVPEIFADPFHGGRIMDATGCARLFAEMLGAAQRFDVRFLAVTPAMAIVERMLNNLKAVYLRNGDTARLQGVMALRAAFPGLGRAERDEFRRLMAPFN
jgi:regulator of sirC expression with transglutaminase-like and TPR domain